MTAHENETFSYDRLSPESPNSSSNFYRNSPSPGGNITPGGNISRAYPVIFSAILVCLVAYIGFGMGSIIVDDAYIYLRVVENILRGDGWSFNPGDLVNPCSGVGYALLLIALSAVTGLTGTPLLQVAFVLGLSLLAVLIVAPWRTAGFLYRAALAAAIVANPIVVESIGMEMVWFLALIVAAGELLDRRKVIGAGCILGISSLMRPEGGIAFVIAGLFTLSREGILSSLKIAWGLLIPLGWFAFAQNEFGSIIPHSVTVKQIQSSIGWWAQQGNFGRYFVNLSPMPSWLFALCALAGMLCFFGIKQTLAVRLVVSVGLVHLALFSVLNAPQGYPWYAAPGVVAMLALLLAPIFFVVEQQRFRLVRWQQFALVLFAVGIVASVGPRPFWTTRENFRFGDEYKLAAQFLKQHAQKGDSVAAAEIGYLGYFTGVLPIVDMHALIHPAALEFIKEESPFWWYQKMSPQYIVAHNPRWPNEPTPINWPAEMLTDFESRYALVKSFPAKQGIFSQNETLEVYQLRDHAITETKSGL